VAEKEGLRELMAEKVKIAINPEPLKALEKQLNDFGKFIEKQNEIMARVCKKCEPLARTLVMQQVKSRLGRITGELEGWINRTIVYPTKKGIRIGPPTGLSEDNYKKMGALQYGWQPGLKVQNKKARKNIKEANRAAGVGGVIDGTHYYELEGAAIQQFEKAFTAHYQVEINRALGLAK
jgi:hypothetical protein